MKKLIETIKNIFSIEELRSRIFNTLILLAVFRVGTFIRIPGIDKVLLDEINKGNPAKGLMGLDRYVSQVEPSNEPPSLRWVSCHISQHRL